MSPRLWVQALRNNNVRTHAVYYKIWIMIAIFLQFMTDMEVQEEKPVRLQMIIFNPNSKKVPQKES